MNRVLQTLAHNWLQRQRAMALSGTAADADAKAYFDGALTYASGPESVAAAFWIYSTLERGGAQAVRDFAGVNTQFV